MTYLPLLQLSVILPPSATFWVPGFLLKMEYIRMALVGFWAESNEAETGVLERILFVNIKNTNILDKTSCLEWKWSWSVTFLLGFEEVNWCVRVVQTQSNKTFTYMSGENAKWGNTENYASVIMTSVISFLLLPLFQCLSSIFNRKSFLLFWNISVKTMKIFAPKIQT